MGSRELSRIVGCSFAVAAIGCQAGLDELDHPAPAQTVEGRRSALVGNETSIYTPSFARSVVCPPLGLRKSSRVDARSIEGGRERLRERLAADQVSRAATASPRRPHLLQGCAVTESEHLPGAGLTAVSR